MLYFSSPLLIISVILYLFYFDNPIKQKSSWYCLIMILEGIINISWEFQLNTCICFWDFSFSWFWDFQDSWDFSYPWESQLNTCICFWDFSLSWFWDFQDSWDFSYPWEFQLNTSICFWDNAETSFWQHTHHCAFWFSFIATLAFPDNFCFISYSVLEILHLWHFDNIDALSFFCFKHHSGNKSSSINNHEGFSLTPSTILEILLVYPFNNQRARTYFL